MTDSWGNLRVKVRNEEIIITLPGTNYMVTYYRSATSPQLLAKYFPRENDNRIPLTHGDFLRRAWKLANYKARELGWFGE